MLIHIVRKDFLIVKKYVLLMLVVCVFIPPFMMWRIDDATYVGSMSFILAAIFSVFMLLQYVSLKENQYAKASTLLCATPYPLSLIHISYNQSIIVSSVSLSILLQKQDHLLQIYVLEYNLSELQNMLYF